MKKSDMKKIIIIISFSILILLICASKVYGIEDVLGAAANGVAGLFLLIPKFLIVAIGAAVRVILGFFTGKGMSGLTVQDILFNKVPITDINFFDFNSSDATVNAIRENVAAWYVGIRNLSAVLLVIVALYVGLRMAISTIAEDRAKYKQMLIDWITSICILFLLHYIMIIIISINNTLVATIGDKQNLKNQDLEDVANKFRDYALGGDNPFSWATNGIINGFTDGFAPTFAAAVIYLMIEVMTLIFLLSYIKRMITIGFLIIIAPLITVTYSIDKMGDGKSQALNTWIKEFTYNILIQPFQCITYLALCASSFDILQRDPDFKSAIIAIAMMIFLFTSEKIIKHIFHFQSESMADTFAAAGLTYAGFARFTSAGRKMFGENNSTQKESVPKTKNQGEMPPSKTPNIESNDTSNTPAGESAGALPPSRGGDSGNQSGGDSSTSGGNPTGDVQSNPESNSRNSEGPTRKHKAGSRARRIGAKAAGIIIRGNEFALRTGLGIAMGGATGKYENIPVAVSEVGQLTSGYAKRKAMETQTSHYKKEVARAFEDYREYKKSIGEEVTLEQAGADGMAFLQDLKQAQSREEKAFRDALVNMRANYMKNGNDEKESLNSVSEVVNGVVSGEITEQWAPPKFIVSSKEKWNNFMARHGRNNGSKFGNNGSGENDSSNGTAPTSGPIPTSSGGDGERNRNRNSNRRGGPHGGEDHSSRQNGDNPQPNPGGDIPISDPEEDKRRDSSGDSRNNTGNNNKPTDNDDSNE